MDALHAAGAQDAARSVGRTMSATAAQKAAESAYFGTASAQKRGRNAEWPYVPVLLITDSVTGITRQSQIIGKAFKTRQEAVVFAQAHVARCKKELAAKLVQPQYRALREQYGLPRELEA